MKKYIHLLPIFLLLTHLAEGQNLYQHPSLSYLGTRLETMHLLNVGGIPYDGIGKRVLMAEYPVDWQAGLDLFELPASERVDAFGVVSSRNRISQVNKPHFLEFGTDRFGTLNVGMKNWKRLSNPRLLASNRTHFQRVWATDRNGNGMLDFHPGHRFFWQPKLNFERGNWGVTADAQFFDVKRWGGTKGFDPDDPAETRYGHSLDARHVQVALRGHFKLTHRRKVRRLEWMVDHTSHDQQRGVALHRLDGKERITTGYLAYHHGLAFGHLTGGLQYTSDRLTETLDGRKHEPLDEYWKLFGQYRTYFSKRTVLKTFANLEMRPGGKFSFLPNAQIDMRLGGDNAPTLSVFGLTGQRLAKPLNWHFDWLAAFPNIDFEETGKLERSEKIGLALNYQANDHRLLTKLTIDHARFKNKAVLQRSDFGTGLEITHLSNPLDRTAIEWLGYAKIGQQYYQGLDLHLIYRWEHFDQRELLPFQSVHQAQVRLRQRFDGASLSAHYLVRNPQQSLVRRVDQPAHRLDLSAEMELGYFVNSKGPWKNMTIGLHWDNVIRTFGNENGLSEAGLLNFSLLPNGSELWSDPTAGNVRLRVGVGL